MTVPLGVEKPVIDAENPWPGLASFDEGARDFFRGRDTEAAELTRIVSGAALTVLFGKSGLGKTSLINAGLFPELRRLHMLPVYVRLDVRDRRLSLVEQAGAALSTQIQLHGVDEVGLAKGRVSGTDSGAPASLWERLHGRGVQWWSARNQPLTPVFVFDQFEEAFTLGTENRSAIRQLRLDLADLIENRIPEDVAKSAASGGSVDHLDLQGQRYKIVLSFREDFLPQVEAWKSHIPSLMRNRFRLVAMTADRALQVVLGDTPEGRRHSLVEVKTGREIVEFVGAVDSAAARRGGGTRPRTPIDRPWTRMEIEPALLSLVCAELNEARKRRGQPTIDGALLKETGHTIISDFYDRTMADVPRATQEFIEDKLITETGFRNSYPLADALNRRLVTEDTLRGLIDRRLLRIEHQLGADRVELTHDLLTDAVRQHRDRDRQRRLAKKQRRTLSLVAVALTVLAAVSGSLALLWNNARNARAAAEQSEQRAQAAFLAALAPKLATSSRYILDGVRNGTTDIGLLLAAAAYRIQPDNDTYVGLRYALDSTRDLAKVVVLPEPVVAISPDGRTAVAGPWNELSLYDTATGQRRGELMTSISVGAPRVVFSPDNQRIATIGVDDPVPVRIWDAATGRPDESVRIGAGGVGFVTAVAFNPDRKTIAIASEDLTLRLWNTETGELRGRPSSGHAGAIRTLAFSPDGSRIASGGDDARIIVWDAATGERLLGPLVFGQSPILSVEFNADGKLLLARSLESRLAVLEIPSGRLQRKGVLWRPPDSISFEFSDVSPGNQATITAATFGQEAGSLVIGTDDRMIHFVGVPGGYGFRDPISRHVSAVRALVVDRQERPFAEQTVMSASEDGSVRTWRFYTGLTGFVLASETPSHPAFAVSADGTTVAGTTKRAVTVWEPEGNLRDRDVMPVSDFAIDALALTADGKTLAVATSEQTIRVLDAGTGETRIAPWRLQERLIHGALAISTDGRFVVASSLKSIDLWDLRVKPPINRSLTGLSSGAASIAFSPDGRWVVAGVDLAAKPGQSQKLNTLRVWETATGEHLPSGVDDHDSPVSAVAFSPSGRYIASVGAGGGHVWDMTGDRKESRSLIGFTEGATTVAFNLGSDKERSKVAFNPGSDTVATGSVDGRITLWEVATGEPRGLPFDTRSDPLAAVGFAPDGKSLFGIDPRGTLLRLPAAPVWVDLVCARVVRNLTRAEWTRYVGERVDYVTQCPGLPSPP